MTQSQSLLNPLSNNSTKWWNTLKQFVGNLQRNCLSVSDHFVGLTLTKVNVVSVSLKYSWMKMLTNFRFSTRKEYKINNYDNHSNFSICWYNFWKKNVSRNRKFKWDIDCWSTLSSQRTVFLQTLTNDAVSVLLLL